MSNDVPMFAVALEQKLACNPPTSYGGMKDHYVFWIPYAYTYNLRYCKLTCNLSRKICRPSKKNWKNVKDVNFGHWIYALSQVN